MSDLIPLSTGQPGLRCQLSVEVHSQPAPPSLPSAICHLPSSADGQAQPAPAVLDFISSDPTLDRYHEIISPAGWHLATYQKNPVFQNAHQYGDIIFTLGRALITEVRVASGVSPDVAPGVSPGSQVLFQRIQFAVDANPMAKIAYALYKDHFLHAVSVGFVPLRWEDGTAQSPFRRKYLEQDLLEVSAVAIPANPNALALAYKSGALEKSDLKETAALINHLVATPQSPEPDSRITHHASRSLLFLRQLRDILRS